MPGHGAVHLLYSSRGESWFFLSILLGYNVQHATDREVSPMRQILWTVPGVLIILSALAHSDLALAQRGHDPAFAPTPTPTPAEPTQPATRTTILLPNIGSTGPNPTELPLRRGWVTVGIVALIVVAGAAFVWGGKKRGQ